MTKLHDEEIRKSKCSDICFSLTEADFEKTEIRELSYLDTQLDAVKYMQKHIPKFSIWSATIKINN